MSNIKYFNVNLGLNGDVVTGAYRYEQDPFNYNYPFGIGKDEKFDYKTGGDGKKIDIWETVLDFFKNHNPVSDLTRTNIDHTYITEYFDCVRLDRLYDDIHRYAEVYEDLYNGYCDDTARGGKTTSWDGITPIPVMTSPVSVRLENDETYKNDDAEIFVKIRGIPIPMRKYKLSDNTLMWKFPEYAFAFRNSVECIESMIPSKDIKGGSYTHRDAHSEPAPDISFNKTEFRAYGAPTPNYTKEGSTQIRLGALNIVR